MSLQQKTLWVVGGEFTKMYPNLELNESGYLVNGKHWIGVGLGQWTGPRCKALYDFAKKDGRRNIFTFWYTV